MGCDVRYLNDSYRLNGLKPTAAQQVRLLSLLQLVSVPKVAGYAAPTVTTLTYIDRLQGSVQS